jgi:hypothetical protein
MNSEEYRKAIEEFAREREVRLAQPIAGHVEVVGVYPVRAAEPCHLIELMMRGVGPGFDFGSISQPIPSAPSSLWQVPWGEVLLDKDYQEVLARGAELSYRPELLVGDLRVAFFMHHLDGERPLKSPFGDIRLPKPVTRPKRLKTVRYERPD